MTLPRRRVAGHQKADALDIWRRAEVIYYVDLATHMYADEDHSSREIDGQYESRMLRQKAR